MFVSFDNEMKFWEKNNLSWKIAFFGRIGFLLRPKLVVEKSLPGVNMYTHQFLHLILINRRCFGHKLLPTQQFPIVNIVKNLSNQLIFSEYSLLNYMYQYYLPWREGQVQGFKGKATFL